MQYLGLVRNGNFFPWYLPSSRESGTRFRRCPGGRRLRRAAGRLHAGVLCLWSGVMEVMNACGLFCGLAGLPGPCCGRLLPKRQPGRRDSGGVSANVSANLLGLGNAATPLGIRAARRNGPGLRRRRQRRALYPGGAEHRLHPADPRHCWLPPPPPWQRCPFDILPAVCSAPCCR